MKKTMEYTAPDALFNLDETHSVTTLHAKNDAKRAAAKRFADGDNSEEEDSTDSASKKRNLGKLSNDKGLDNGDGDGNKTISWSPHSSSEECLAGRGAAGGRIVRTSYPSSTTGGTQQMASSGQCNVPDWSRHNGRSENLVLDNNNGLRSRSRANRWRQSNKMYRMIETVDGLGNKTRQKIYGSMATTEHNKILSILERRACRFRPELQQVLEQEQLENGIALPVSR